MIYVGSTVSIIFHALLFINKSEKTTELDYNENVFLHVFSVLLCLGSFLSFVSSDTDPIHCTGLCNNTKVQGDDRLKLPRQMRSVITLIIQNSQKKKITQAENECRNYFKRIPVRAWTGVWNFYYGIIQVISINTICIFISTSIQRLQCSYVQCGTYFSSCFLLHQFLMSVDISVNIRKLH